MKKIVLSLIIGLGIIACKKEDHKMQSSSPKSDSVSIDKPVQNMDTEHIDIHELKPEKITLDLKNKANDTLYITNFFATWCGPCMQEIPHFKEKMEELSSQPVKFTFVSLDNKDDWQTKVNDFADEYDIRKNVVLLDGTLLDDNFFKANFKTWTGEAIPFTLMKKGNLDDEYMGTMTKELLDTKVKKLLSTNVNANINEQKERNKLSGPSSKSNL